MVKDPRPTAFSRLVKNRRTALGLSQEEVSDRIGLSQEWTSMVERGAIRQPRIATLQKLAPVLRVPIEDLIIAVGYATTREGADRVTPDEIDDPKLQASFLALAELNPKRLDDVMAFIETMKRLDEPKGE